MSRTRRAKKGPARIIKFPRVPSAPPTKIIGNKKKKAPKYKPNDLREFQDFLKTLQDAG
jgi:hypothetical protein